MYEEADQRLLTDKSLKKHRHVKIWWYVILGLCVGVFCAQVHREVTREPTKSAVATSLQTVLEDERRVGEDEKAVDASSRGGVKYDYVQNLTPSPKKEAKVAADGLMVPKVPGIKYAYVPKNGPIPTFIPQEKNIPGIKYQYIPNDGSEKSVQEAQPSESSSDSFQMLESDVDQGSAQSSEAGETMQSFADESSERTVSSPQKPVGEPMNDEISVDNGAFKDLLDDVDSTQKQFTKHQPKEERVKSNQETREEMRKAIEAQMGDDSDLPDDDAYTIPADTLTHDDFNIAPKELFDDHEMSAASPMQRQNRATVSNPEPVAIPQESGEAFESNLANNNFADGSSQYANTFGAVQESTENTNFGTKSQKRPKPDWRDELLSDDFSDFHV